MMVENELSLIGNATNVNRDAGSSISSKSDVRAFFHEMGLKSVKCNLC